MRLALAALLGVFLSTPALADPPRRGHHGHHARAGVQVQVRQGDPWRQGYRPAAHRPGFVWVAGSYRYGAWGPGYWSPVQARPGYLWVPGFWDGGFYVEGFWRPVSRAGHSWVGGFYDGRSWVAGYWRPAVRTGHVWVDRRYDGSRWTRGSWQPRSVSHRGHYRDSRSTRGRSSRSRSDRRR